MLGRDLYSEFREEDWFGIITQNGRPELPVRFTISPELIEFPFEMLPLDRNGTDRLGIHIPISRRLLGKGKSVKRSAPSPETMKKDLRILVVAADIKSKIKVQKDTGEIHAMGPGGSLDENEKDDWIALNPINLDEEVKELRGAFKQGKNFIEQITWLANKEVEIPEIPSVTLPPTASQFEDCLNHKNNAYDMVHFIGHGIFSDKFKGLVFPDQAILMYKMVNLFSKQDHLGFVYLSCCESARGEQAIFNERLSGLSQACIEAGVPSVLGMRWQIPLIVSSTMSAAFYRCFMETGSLDDAVFRARLAVEQMGENLNIYSAAPILFVQ